MTSLSEAFEALRAANPVTDTAVLHADRPPAADYAASLDRTDIVLDVAAEQSPHGRQPWLVAAAVLAVALAIGAWFLTRSDTVEQQPIEAIDPDELVERDAIAKAEQWLSASNSGDMDTILRISDPSASDIANRRLIEWLATFAANDMPTRLGSCEVTPSSLPLTVRCHVIIEIPVAQELGVDRLTAPFRYEDGVLTWLPYEGGDIGLVNDAFADYLRVFEPSRYEDVCIPGSYELGSIVQDRGLALTGDCAQLAAPLADAVAQWISDGKPGS